MTKSTFIHTLIFIVLASLIASCVPNRKLVYLQKDNELKENFPKDTILRTYNLADYEYRIQPEDILSIRFQTLTEDEYNIFNITQQGNQNNVGQNVALNGYLVDQAGYIRFPEIGEVEVLGLTLHELEDLLEKLAIQYVDQPLVKIFLLNYRVTVLGEVNGEKTISTNNNRLTLMEALANAGGLTDMADRSKVKIIRQRNGKSEIVYVNLLKEELMSENTFFTHQNDIIIVSPLRQRSFRRYFGQNLSLFVSTVSVILLTLNLISN